MGHVAYVATARHKGNVVGNRLLERTLQLIERHKPLRMRIERQLKAAHHIEHRDIVQAVHAPRNREFDAAHNSVIARIFKRNPTIRKCIDIHFVVKALRQTIAQANDFARLVIKTGGSMRMHAQREVGLWQTRILLHIEQQVRQVV